MSGESMRRLATVVMADISGYSRLMGADENGTHLRVQRLFGELIGPTIVEHRGRLIKTRGDGFFAMFDSPVEAVRCAIVIQQSMVGRNLELPSTNWIRFRIGVNLGDVIVTADDVYGEGVNVAARLEQLAEPGNIYISGGVYEQIRYKLVCGYQSLGDKKVKNIADPVPIYRVLPDPAALAKAARRGRVRLGVLGAMMALVIAIGGGWYAWHHAIERPLQSLAAATQAPAQLAIAPPARAPIGAPEQRALALPAPAAPRADFPKSAPEAPPGPAVTNPGPPPVSQPPMSPSQEEAAVVPPRIQSRQKEATTVVAEPEMIPITGGVFRMGSHEDPSEQPVHSVTIKPFLVAKYPVTIQEWRACVTAKACSYTPNGDNDAPVSNVSWDDAQQFVAWLSQVTQRHFRLLSEAEWEYVARGGTDSRYWWGDAMKPGFVDCDGCGGPQAALQPTRVGTLPPNPFGLYDIGGGVAEWVEDCWHNNYRGAPTDGSAWLAPDCRERVLRGGSWRGDPSDMRVANRDFYDAPVRYPTHGFRLARWP
jgi:formylglycine-generating enzyme required for sulfatase activity/class 3 adenylate cyclase